jgi:flavin-dependent dehydrogenase
MNSEQAYDIAIIGGGLAGLSAAILLSRKAYKVLVLEKESYPKHKVCGEYISMESRPFLESLGISVADLKLPVVDMLQVTDTKGNEVIARLPQGGFGISRYMLDAALAEIAVKAGTTLVTKTRADDVQQQDDYFTITTRDQVYNAKVVCGTWGKRSNIDVKWQRSFLKEGHNALNNYIAIKYHIKYPWPQKYVGLHNFSNGYCGISYIEDGKCCLCYLTTAANLQMCGNDIKILERDVIKKNPWLDQIFSNAEFLYQSPLAISQISFQKKEIVRDHVLLMGDAAGMITPLCGNGMSMAMHAAKLAAEAADNFLQGRISRSEMEHSYIAAWKKNFSNRISLGRVVQNNFGKNRTTSLFLRTFKLLPFLKKPLIAGTSGKIF